mmetsp:Transcript_21507/g.43456  ORF Transcript_21507/g.43456 Transcript_21507/m.43456 type:complete len:82 (-) Transcript_21507:228-473(-)
MGGSTCGHDARSMTDISRRRDKDFWFGHLIWPLSSGRKGEYTCNFAAGSGLIRINGKSISSVIPAQHRQEHIQPICFCQNL